MAKYCIKCGAELRPDSKFCLKCGAPVSGKKIDISQNGKDVLASDVSAKNQTVSKKGKGGFTKFVIIILVAAIGFTGFVKPGYILKWIKNKPTDKPPVEENIISDDGLVELSQYNNPNVSNEIPELPDEIGNSAALSYSPLSGFKIEAQANAFYEDTTINMKPLEKLDQTAVKAVSEISDEGYWPIGLYEVDGGLEDQEMIPGEYTVSVDPSVFDVDPALYEYIRVYRIGDDGVYYECSSYIDDGKIVYRADQNCITAYVISVIAIISTIGIGVYLENGRPVQYFYDANRKKITYSETYKGINFKIHYALEDIGESVDAETKRMQEICEAYARRSNELYNAYKEEHYFDASKPLDYYTASKSVAEVVLEAVNNDAEYKKLKEKVDKPGVIDLIVNYTKKSFDYLKDHEYVKMPTGTVEITCLNMGGNLAEASTRNYHEGYIELHLADVLKGDKAKKFNLLLTMAHEILHVCQQKYRAWFADSNRYDEMVAVDMEKRAWDYFIYTGDIEDGVQLELSPTAYWSTLKLPLDKTADNKDVLKHQGYLLSQFVSYLKDRTKATIWAGKLMNARSYYFEPGISKPLMAVFKIPEVEFDAYYRNFVRKNRTNLANQYNKKEREYKGNDPIPISKGVKHFVRVDPQGSYSSEIRGFMQSDASAMTLLWIPDDRLFSDSYELQIFPIDGYEAIPKGAYIHPIASKDGLIDVNYNRNFLEIHGKIAGIEENSVGTELSPRAWGYTVYVFDKTKTPSFGENDDELIVKLPENSKVAEDKVIDGYLLKLETEEGKKLEYEISSDYFEKEFSIKKKELFDKKEKTDELLIYATMVEYVKNKNGDKLFGEESDNVSYVINTDQSLRLNDFSACWIPVEDKNPTGDSFVLGLIYVKDYDEFGYFESQYKYWINEGRWSEMPYRYDEKTGILTMSFDRGEATFELLDKNTLLMTNYGGSYKFYRLEE